MNINLVNFGYCRGSQYLWKFNTSIEEMERMLNELDEDENIDLAVTLNSLGDPQGFINSLKGGSTAVELTEEGVLAAGTTSLVELERDAKVRYAEGE
jgi:hypothetical protein